MDIFGWLIVGHLVGDFLLQNNWMALNKTRNLIPLMVHSLVYTGAVGLFALLGGGLSLPSLAIIFFSHILLDNRVFVGWWVKYVNGAENIPWMKIVVDQSWHVLILALIILI